MIAPIQARFKLDYGDFALDVDLQMPGSGVTALFGPSGSGKTSVLRCIAGFQQAQQGFLQVNGQIWHDSAQRIFLSAHQRPIGYVFQEALLFPHLSVADNLLFGLKRLSGKPRLADQQALIDLLGIGHLLSRRPERLSGGEKQRVAIARALALNPQILLMDEPLAALDHKRKQEILPFLTRLHRELAMPVVYVTHSQQEVAQLADHLVMMDQGKVLASGALLDLLSQLGGPLAHEANAETVWPVTVLSHDPEYALTQVAFAGGCLHLQPIDAETGTALRVQIHARDVSIVLEPATRTSILNIFPAIIDALRNDEQGRTVVRLLVGQLPLLAHITRKSAVSLGLAPGMRVYAQVKGSSILR